MSTFGSRLRLLRSERGLYIYEMADALHHARKTQEDYERDEKTPSIERATEIANYFGCPLSWILGEGRTFAYESTTEDFIKVVNAGFQAMADMQRKNGWISVKDSLPDCGDRILLTDGNFVGEGYRVSGLNFNRHYGSDIKSVLGVIVTHWMPMPEQPKEE